MGYQHTDQKALLISNSCSNFMTALDSMNCQPAVICFLTRWMYVHMFYSFTLFGNAKTAHVCVPIGINY